MKSLNDSSLLPTNASVLLQAVRESIWEAKKLLVQILGDGQWHKRGEIVVALHEKFSPEVLARVSSYEARLQARQRPNRISPEAQAWSGARRAVSRAISNYADDGIIIKRMSDGEETIAMLRLPKRGFCDAKRLSERSWQTG